MKTLWTIIIAIVAMAVILGSCKGSATTVKVDHKDSVEYAVYDGVPITHYEDLEPVYVPLRFVGFCRTSDIVWIDTATNEMKITPPLNEHNQIDTIHFERVVLGKRLQNRWFKLGSAD